MDDDMEHQLRAELSRVVAAARRQRRLSERADHGDDDVTRRRLSDLGIFEAVRAGDGGFAHLLAAVEEAAVGLVAGDLLGSALALWTGLATRPPAAEPPRPPLGPVAVAWPGVTAGADPLRPAEDGSVTGRLGYVPFGLSTQDVLLVLPDGPGARIGLAALDGAHRAPLPVLDRTRPAATIELRSAPVRDLGRLTAAEVTRLRAGWLAALAADCLGGMRAAHGAALDYARHRTAFGRSIGGFQAVRHRCADMFVDVETTRAVVRGAVAAVDEDRADALALALTAASHAVDAFGRVAESSILVHGALGFTYECEAHFYARRAYGNAAWLGGVDALRAELVTV